MDRKKYINIILIGILLIFLQTFLQYNINFRDMISKFLSNIAPMIYAFFTALFLEPIVMFFQNKLKTNRATSIILTTICVIAIIIGFVSIIVPYIVASIKDLTSKFPAMQEKTIHLLNQFFDFLASKNIILESSNFKESIINYIKDNLGQIQKISLLAVKNMFWWVIASIKIIIGFVLGILLLFDKDYFINIFLKFLSIFFNKNTQKQTYETLDEARKQMLNYIGGRVVVSIIVGIISFVIMYFFNVPYALLSAVMFLFGNMIPYVGTIIVGLIAIFLVLLENVTKIPYLLLAICVAQIMDAWLIGPKIAGDSLGIKSFWIIAVIFIAGNFFGPIGMFFAVPVLCLVRIIFKLILLHKKEES